MESLAGGPLSRTLCPHCGKPAVLVDSCGAEATVEIAAAKVQRVVERIILCAWCGKKWLVYRVDLLQGETERRRAG